MSKVLSENGLRYEIAYKGSFINKKPPFILNHVLSYRDRYDKYSLPKDVLKSIDKSIRAVEDYAKAAKSGNYSNENIRTDYFKVIREYYTSEGPTNSGMRDAARFAPFLGYKNAIKVLKDLKQLKVELNKAENVPEFKD